ncbi:MAG: PorV/PorQ family protein [Balneolales bacterium]
MKKYVPLVFILLFINAITPLRADDGQSPGMPFLLTGPSAYNMGISDAHTASLSGSSAVYLNPSMLAMEQYNSATVSYYIWPATDTQNRFAGVTFRREKDAFGLAFLSSLNDDIPARSGPSQEPDGMFAITYFSLASSYARKTGPLSLGVTGMYLYEQTLDQNAYGFGLNAGLGLNLLEERLRLGASLRNLGSMNNLAETATKLPTLLSIGTDIQLLQLSTSAAEDEIPLLISVLADYNIPVNEIQVDDETLNTMDEGYFNFGLEVNISEIIDIRTGVRTGDTQRRLSFGAGLWVSDLYFNYAFLPFTTGFGTAHAISLQYFF